MRPLKASDVVLGLCIVTIWFIVIVALVEEYGFWGGIGGILLLAVSGWLMSRLASN